MIPQVRKHSSKSIQSNLHTTHRAKAAESAYRCTTRPKMVLRKTHDARRSRHVKNFQLGLAPVCLAQMIRRYRANKPTCHDGTLYSFGKHHIPPLLSINLCKLEISNEREYRRSTLFRRLLYVGRRNTTRAPLIASGPNSCYYVTPPT